MAAFATNAMVGLLVGVALVLLYLGWLALRNPVLVKIGLRNIPRRPAQTILIVIGLTLSTIIIVSALSTGDTLTYSVRTNAVQAYGPIDEIIAPPLLSLFATLADSGSLDEAVAENEQAAELSRLTEGGLTSLLTVLEGGLPGITSARLDQLRLEAADEPLIDAVAGSIIFPTIIRNTSTGQGEPFGFIFAVDDDYDRNFGLTAIDGREVQVEALEPGVGNIFAYGANLLTFAQQGVANLGLPEFSLSNVAVATATIVGALTGAAQSGGLDLATIHIDLATLRGLGIDTTFLEEQGIESLSLAELGITPERLSALGVTTTTVSLDNVSVGNTEIQTATNQFMAALNLNTMGTELDRMLSQVGLQLRQGDVYLNRLGAEQLEARQGDVLEVYIGPLPLRFRVKAVVDQAGPVSALAPVVVLRLDEAQKLLFMNGRVNNILISNAGDEMAGIEHTAAVTDRLRVLAMDPALVEQAAAILRRPAVRDVLAANRDSMADEFNEEYEGPEFLRGMIEGMAGFAASRERVDTLVAELEQPDVSPALRELLANIELRSWISGLPLPAADGAELRGVLSKLNQFDVMEPLSKASVVGIAEIGGVVFSSAFSVLGLLSILAGILLIFLIFVMMAAERRSEMGVARAVGMQRTHLVQMFVTEGVVYDLLAAALGVLLGLAISYAMVGFLGNLFNTAAEQLSGQSGIFRIRFHAAPTSIVIAYCLGVLFTFVVVTAAAWRVSRLNIVAAIRDLEEPPGPARTSLWGRTLRLVFGPVLAIAGVVIIVIGVDQGVGLVQIGVSLVAAGIAFGIGFWLERSDRRQETVQRVVYSIIGLALLVTWALPWSRWITGSTMDITRGAGWSLAALVLGGPMLILGAILVVMFNADVITAVATRVFGGIGVLTPVLKTAIAYPLSARFRTGMTILLFAMIISVVTLMTIVIEATQSLATPDSERYAGFDIQVSSTLLSFFDPLEDLASELPSKEGIPPGSIAAISGIAQLPVAVQQTAPGDNGRGLQSSTLRGVDAAYLDQGEQVYDFRLRAEGYADDASVWEALRTRTDVAVVTRDQVVGLSAADAFAGMEEQAAAEDTGAGGPERYHQLRIAGVTDGAALPDIRLMVSTEAGNSREVQVIAVVEQLDSLADEGIWVNAALLPDVAGEPVYPNSFYIKVAPGADVHVVSRALEAAFLNNAANSVVLAESFAQAQALTRGILQLFQGFLALGLLVGIAALGVISTRTVVERRQQVGMLRAIGFQPRMVALSFLLESSFIALTGIVVGSISGALMGHALINAAYSSFMGEQVWVLPWGQILAIVAAAYLFSLLTTFVPALQASRIYPAEALRYE
jgi:putative ABC transport system permease protein